ncbi:uncharacterized protein LOC126967331 [Leptidea sinapis]|uniref:uncharacterized protein LOC126967331 n=1 Tax=Leptidea sinapis TaxID=189913 RepID=UPI0021C27E8A|nr:uncharacterized protein LOC126967331 [Leptidea sinapis]
MGIVRRVPVDLSMNDFVESVSLPTGCGKILKARRFNRKVIEEGKVTWLPTQTIVITFHGQVLPEKISLFHNSLPVETYLFPTIQCLNCCRFGHIKTVCRSNPRCYKCTQAHAGSSCDTTEKDAICINCSGQHFATNKECPELGRQKTIKIIMSQENISYEEASNRCPKVMRPYSEILRNPSVSHNYSSAHMSQTPTPSPTVSYKKTVFSSPRSKPLLSKPYDRAAHQAIIADVPSAFPNGSALNHQVSSSSSTQDDNLLEALLSILLSLITKNNLSLPSNVAHQLSQILSIGKIHGPSVHSSMEHQKPTS